MAYNTTKDDAGGEAAAANSLNNASLGRLASPGPPSTPNASPADEPSTDLVFDPVALRARFDGWTPERQRAFIEELADCGIVREAAARVGMTEQSATRLRRRADAAAFSLAWDAALRLGAERLRSIAWERAVMGVAKPRYYRGEKVGEERVYDNRLLLSLLRSVSPPPARYQLGAVIRDWDRWMEAIEDGLEAPPPRPHETSRSPVWQEEDGSWWTRFPPPPGFDGPSHGDPGDRDYCRACTPEEQAPIEAVEERREKEAHRRRDAYFARMK